ncbi:hypothetical protein, partial [Brevundimonas sp.]|uniref:hypothetical protein n=2 Tax=unclassified Brevundimonas TaxID=2622653 RepID=UPI00289D754D
MPAADAQGQSVPPARIPQAGDGPFQKGRIVWGRPPQATFMAGPLPRDEGLARLLSMPPHPQPANSPRVTGSVAAGSPAAAGNGAGSLGGGSNIPGARSTPSAP